MGIWRASCDDDSDNMNRWCAFMNNTGETNRPPHKLCVFLPWSLYILCRHNGICVRKWRFYSTLSHKTSFPCTRRYIWASLSLLILSFLCTYIYIPQFYDLLGLRPTSGFLFLCIQTSAYWWKESRWSATTGHTQKKDFFFSLFFLFILNKKEIINTIKEIYIKKSHFFMVFKWCPLLRNFRHETCVVFSPLLLILYRMFFFLYFMFNGYETWIDTRWLFRRTELLGFLSCFIVQHEFFSTCHKSKKESRVRYGFLFWVNPFAEIFFSLSFSEVRDSRLTVVFLPLIYRHLL